MLLLPAVGSERGDGDWNADDRFDSGDFVVAFENGGYELGTRAATAAVPEPSSWTILHLVCLALAARFDDEYHDLVGSCGLAEFFDPTAIDADGARRRGRALTTAAASTQARV